MCRAEFSLPSITAEEGAQEKKAPIRVKFEIPYFTVSGIQVIHLMFVVCVSNILSVVFSLESSVCEWFVILYIMQVRYLKIIEKSGYQALPWVRYITMAGEYELRLIWATLFSGYWKTLMIPQDPEDTYLPYIQPSVGIECSMEVFLLKCHTRFPPCGLLFILLGTPYHGSCKLPIKYSFGKKKETFTFQFTCIIIDLFLRVPNLFLLYYTENLSWFEFDETHLVINGWQLWTVGWNYVALLL